MNPQELIKKLNNINLDELLNSLKTTDYKKLLKDLRTRPDVIVIIVSICLALIIPFKLYATRRGELTALTMETASLEKKIEAIDAYHDAQKELKEFINNVPEHIIESDFMNQMTDFAESRGIRIKSFSPAKKQSDPLYDLTSVILNVSAKEYTDIWLFVHDIENSPYSIRIDNWKGQKDMPGSRRRGRREALPEDPDHIPIIVTLEVASIVFKNE